MKRKIPYILLIIAVASITFYLFYTKALQIHAKCPDEYPNTAAGSQEYIADTNKWTNDFFDSRPGATLSDWSKARYQFWVDNNCQEAIKRYNDAKNGKGDQQTLKQIENTVRESIK